MFTHRHGRVLPAAGSTLPSIADPHRKDAPDLKEVSYINGQDSRSLNQSPDLVYIGCCIHAGSVVKVK